MILFKRIEVDLEKERERINKCPYSKRQRTALLKLVDLFELGEWQNCLDLVNDNNVFKETRRGYSEKEHIGIEISDILDELGHSNYYTDAQLLLAAKKKLKIS